MSKKGNLTLLGLLGAAGIAGYLLRRRAFQDNAAARWTTADMPDQTGKTAVITGGNSGIGYEAALALAQKNASVILAVRSQTRGENAAATIRAEAPGSKVTVAILDLANLDSVRRFAAEMNDAHPVLDLLINNAGVMAIPYRQTADGFEMQFGVNHLGHFALTGLLLESLLRAKNGRVVHVSSNLHRPGKIDFDDLDGQESYDKREAYSQSKLANLLFAYELQRKLAASGRSLISVGAHPGYSDTNLQGKGPEMEGSIVRTGVMAIANRLVAQSSAMGALPVLYAAVAPDVQGCDFIGPDGLMRMRGYPVKEQSSEASYDLQTAARLWNISEELTGVHYPSLAKHPAAYKRKLPSNH